MAAGAVVGFLLNKTDRLLTDEVNLLGGFKKELPDLKKELESIKYFLQQVECRGSDFLEKEGLKTWVKEVRELAYDMEDFLEIFAHSHERDTCTSFSPKGIIQQHRLATQVRELKKKAREARERKSRYPVPESTGPSGLERIDNSAFLDESMLVGFGPPRQLLTSWLESRDDRVKVIGVVGMGGIGKTTLVRKLFEEQKVKSNFKHHAWITVSHFNPRELSGIWSLLRSLISKLFRDGGNKIDDDLDSMEHDQLTEVVREYLDNKRYLVVLDDIWDSMAWENIRSAFPDGLGGSKIMVTTTKQNVAESCQNNNPGNGHIHQLMALSPDESLRLFSRNAFGSTTCPSNLENQAQAIVNKCGGLPLVIKSMGNLVARKKPQSASQWARVLETLDSEMGSQGILENLQTILTLSYNDLPHHLKPCFLCFSIFQKIKTSRLIRIWIAEGFVETTRGVSLEETAREYLNELVDRNLVQAVDKDSLGRCKSCCVNDFMHKIIINKSGEENFVMLYNTECVKDINIGVVDRIRRLAVQKGNRTEIRKRDASSHLRSLIVELGRPLISPESHLPVNHVKFSASWFKLLRVLDLEGTFIDFLPFEFTSSHLLLKYLSFRNTKLVKVPKSLGKLRNLEALDFRGTFITKLPKEIMKLKRLRHLFVPIPPYEYLSPTKDSLFYQWFEYSSFKGVELPFGVGMLQALWDLTLIDASSKISVMRELGQLTQLRKLGIRLLTGEACLELCAAMERMSHLISITLLSISQTEPLLLNNIHSPPLLLERLFLAGRLVNLPGWFSSLSCLNKITLVGSDLRDDPFMVLQALPNLIDLFLVDSYTGSNLQADKNGFLKLKQLHIGSFGGLQRFVLQKGAMPDLQKLSIWYCAELEHVPSGIEHLSHLNELHMVGMPRSFIDSLRQDTGPEHCRIVHVPIVKSSYARDGEWINEIL